MWIKMALRFSNSGKFNVVWEKTNLINLDYNIDLESIYNITLFASFIKMMLLNKKKDIYKQIFCRISTFIISGLMNFWSGD